MKVLLCKGFPCLFIVKVDNSNHLAVNFQGERKKRIGIVITGIHSHEIRRIFDIVQQKWSPFECHPSRDAVRGPYPGPVDYFITKSSGTLYCKFAGEFICKHY